MNHQLPNGFTIGDEVGTVLFGLLIVSFIWWVLAAVKHSQRDRDDK